ncbi:phosphatase PAP2 family protein, partial [Mesorhizobium sp. M7A.F.Ca.US.001.04.1.1]|uniref:phosphatase PAP2 family protein n=2 Tax=Phyllobacteriaceae TaxID=69277 RepID=UPI0032B2AC1E
DSRPSRDFFSKWNGDGMEKLDAQVTGWINNLSGHNNLIDVFMVAVTQAGVPLLILAVVASWWWGGGGRTERHVAVACGLSFLLGLTLNQIVLLLVHRVRPYDAGVSHLLIARSADPSFPSDHATASFAIVFSYVFNARVRKALWFFAAALLLVISRVYVGTHYVGDILGGIATALIAAGLVRIAYREGTRIDRWVTGLL